MDVTLEHIPYVSQRGVDAPLPNDCGIAVVVSFIHAFTPYRPTVIEAARRAGLANGKSTDADDLIKLAGLYGLELVAEPNADINFHLAQLALGLPSIALVNYWPIGRELFSHWLGVVGCGEQIIRVHDPYNPQMTGFTPLSRAQFVEALETVKPKLNWRGMGLRVRLPGTLLDALAHLETAGDALAQVRRRMTKGSA